MTVRIIAVTLVALLVAIGAGLTGAGWLGGEGGGMGIPFDSAAWQDERLVHEEEVRNRMAADLLANHLKQGQTRDEVLALLGPPTDTPYFRDHDLVYWLGAEGGYAGIDSRWLVIDLDDAGHVERAEIVTD